MWELFVLLFLYYISIYVIDLLCQNEWNQNNYSQSPYCDKREKMKFPSSHISTSMITPENSPCTSRIASRLSTPIASSYRSSPVCSESLFQNELYDSPSNYSHHG